MDYELLVVMSGDQNSVLDNADWARVILDTSDAQRYLATRTVLNVQGDYNAVDMNSIRLSDYPTEVFSFPVGSECYEIFDQSAEDEQGMLKLPTTTWVLPSGLNVLHAPPQYEQIESCECCVCHDGVFWVIVPKYVDFEITTAVLPWELIEKMAQGEALTPDITAEQWDQCFR